MDLTNIFLDIYLIRHADPAGLPNHWSSSTTPLSQLGVTEAEEVAQQLINHRFDAFYTSPFKRAKQTAEIIAKVCGHERILEQNWLAEIDVGEWAGRHKKEIQKQINPSLQRFLEKGYEKRGPLVTGLLAINKEFSFPSGENLRAFWDRVSNGFYQTLDYYRAKKHKKICFIGHGGSFTVIMLNLINKSFSDNVFPVFMFRKADLTIIRIKEGQIFFLQMNPFLSLLNEFTLDS